MSAPAVIMDSAERARSALMAIDPSIPRDEWHEVGRAALAAGLTIEDIDAWSADAPNYVVTRDVESAFRTITPNGKTPAGTLFHHAKRHGWTDSERPRPAPSAPTPRPAKKTAPALDPAALWARFVDATDDHGYVRAKRGQAAGLRVVPDGDPLQIAGQSVSGWLAVPVRSLDNTLRTIQFIPPPGTGRKLNLPGASFADGMFIVGDLEQSARVFIAEGVGQGWSIWQATGCAAVICFGAGRMSGVAKLIRKKYPAVPVVITPDAGKESQAAAIAAEIGGSWVEMPDGKPANFDCNDYAAERGTDELADLLEAAKSPAPVAVKTSVPGHSLPFVWACNVDQVGQLVEIVESLLTAGAMSVWYGESNSGKTYLIFYLACCIARELPWLGLRTKRAAVIYVAAEGSATILNRVVAYRTYHDVESFPLGIVTTGVNLLDPAADTDRLISLIIEKATEIGLPVALVVIDTLARAMAGGNENASEDMGALVRNGDRIREATGAHLAWVHHCGKNTALGARGHSSLRAATDTEIEITHDTATGIRCAEVTKQRDLASVGQKLYARLESLTIGENQWGNPVTACIVADADEPPPSSKAGRIPRSATQALDAIRQAISEVGQVSTTAQVPAGKRTVTTKTWRHWYERKDPLNLPDQHNEADIRREQERQRKSFQRARDHLANHQVVGVWGDEWWIL